MLLIFMIYFKSNIQNFVILVYFVCHMQQFKMLVFCVTTVILDRVKFQCYCFRGFLFIFVMENNDFHKNNVKHTKVQLYKNNIWYKFHVDPTRGRLSWS